MRRSIRMGWVGALLACLCVAGMGWAQSRTQARTYALEGTVVTPAGVVRDGMVVVRGGAIEAVGAGLVLPAGTRVVKTGGVIFPGLIDLHNHLIWNVFPRWTPKTASGQPEVVGDRYDWQAMPAYLKALADPEKKMVDRGDGCDMERYAEVKAMLGGATSVVGSYGPTPEDPDRDACDRGLARNLDTASGLYGTALNEEPVMYQVFPFQIPYAEAVRIRAEMDSGKVKALLLHVAEGKDASAAREFVMLKARGFLRPGVTVIHGVALDKTDFEQMAQNGVGLVWSPHSNIALYGVTADVKAAKAADVTMAIAPDWSPSGSDEMVEEMQYAWAWQKQHAPGLFSGEDYVRMATANPAKLAAAEDRIGALKAGMAADIVVFPAEGDAAAMALLKAKPGSVSLVVVGGKPELGDVTLMQDLLPGKKLETMTVCGQKKALNIMGDTGGESWAKIDGHLTQELGRMGIKLAGLVECWGAANPPN
jgi:5-methylthioadenosine/S-adenosylhomocysteine deaminase